MRPDKHKKRKNAAYKKKHGIPSGKGERVGKNGSTSSHRSGEKSSTSAVSVTAKESKAVPETDSGHVRYTMFVRFTSNTLASNRHYIRFKNENIAINQIPKRLLMQHCSSQM